MFGSQILEIVIGLSLVYLLFSILLTSLNEVVEGVSKRRARVLRRAITELLAERGNPAFTAAFYRHPLISALYRGEAPRDADQRADRRAETAGATKGFGAALRPLSGMVATMGDGVAILGEKRRAPTYIPSRNFALALIDLAEQPEAVAGTGGALTLPPDVSRVYTLAVRVHDGDINGVRRDLEAWFDSAMDRASGWYKRGTQWRLFVGGLILAVAANVNSLTLAQHLAVNDAARAAMLRVAEGVARPTGSVATDPAATEESKSSERAQDANGGQTSPLTPEQAVKLTNTLREAGLPIGWSAANWALLEAQSGPGGVVQIAFGYVLTALALALGAPFWFDLLNKFMVIRSTVKPHEKSPEEGSEDGADNSRSAAASATGLPLAHRDAPPNGVRR